MSLAEPKALTYPYIYYIINHPSLQPVHCLYFLLSIVIALSVAGKMQKNKLNNETEISIAEIYTGDVKPKTDKYSINPDFDFVVGAQTDYGIIELVEKDKRSPYYTDGEMYWYEGKDFKVPCNF